MVRRELAADPQGAADRDGTRVLEALDREQDPHPEVTQVPVLRVQLVPLRLHVRPAGIVPDVPVLPAHPHEAVPGEHVEVVAGRAEAEPEGADDGPEVVPREQEEMRVDPLPRRVVQADGPMVGSA